MALKKHQCGNKTISYEETCSFSCSCWTTFFCDWRITCNGKTVATGTSKPRVRPTTDTIYVDGMLGDIAKSLEERWGRPVTVPRGMRSERITRRAKGTPEQIAQRLGLKLVN
jgi:hypothetical protein